MQVVSKQEMILAEKFLIHKLHYVEELIIENVGRELADKLKELHVSDKSGEFIFFVGKGNNAADALCTARHLHLEKYRVRIYLLMGSKDCSVQFKKQIKMIQALNIPSKQLNNHKEILKLEISKHDVVIDGLFGTGLGREIDDKLAMKINAINQLKAYKVAIDVPSGLDANTGKVLGCALKTDQTWAIGRPKLGHFINAGPLYSGRLEVLLAAMSDLAFKQFSADLILANTVNWNLLQRGEVYSKYDYGHVLIIAGSRFMPGAAQMAAHAALKSGVGLVSLATWKDAHQSVCSGLASEIMCYTLPENDSDFTLFSQNCSKYDAICLGPGLYYKERVSSLLSVLKDYNGPLIIDADAIDGYAKLKRKRSINNYTVLTPHLGEYNRIRNCQKKEIQLLELKKIAQQLKAAVILKGPNTLYQHYQKNLSILPGLNSGLGKAGAGDVLAGLLAGLLALESSRPKRAGRTCYEQMTKLALLIHANAAQWAKEKFGPEYMTAQDVITCLQKIYQP